jgi:hypothetical protein
MDRPSVLLKRYIAKLTGDEIFTTRDCLPFGSRAAIDQGLSRLVKANILVRLARGVFMLKNSHRKKPSIGEIAQVKAQSFGRLIATHGSTLAYQCGLQAKPPKEVLFSVNSSSSTFKAGNIQVHLKKTCWRKMSLQRLRVGKVLIALWHVGQGNSNQAKVTKAIGQFGHRDKVTLRESMRWIPAWLGANFLEFPFNHINRQLVTI